MQDSRSAVVAGLGTLAALWLALSGFFTAQQLILGAVSCIAVVWLTRRLGILSNDGARLGILGLGPIGRAVARRARGFGMEVLGWTRSGRRVEGVTSVGFEELLERADFVSVHVALTPETRGLLGGRELARMKQGAVLVNTARGPLVDPDALLAALDSGHLLGAGLDVTEPEPLPPDHPLLGRLDVVVTPHVASGTPEARERNFMGAFEQVMQVLNGQRPDNLVNEAVWDTVLDRLG